MIVFVEGLIDHINLVTKTLTIKKDKIKSVITNVDNIRILEHYPFKYQHVILYHTSTKSEPPYRISRLWLPGSVKFRHLLNEIIGTNSYFLIKNADALFDECEHFLTSSDEILRWDPNSKIKEELLTRIQDYLYFLKNLSSTTNSSTTSKHLEPKDQFYARLNHFCKIHNIPPVVYKLVIRYDEDFGNENQSIADIPIDILMDKVFLILESGGYFWKFYTKEGSDKLLRFITDYCNFRLTPIKAKYLIDVHKTLSAIIVLLKDHTSDTYLEYNRLCVKLHDIGNLEQVLQFMDARRLIKIITVDQQRFITTYERYEQERYVSEFLQKRSTINPDSIQIDEDRLASFGLNTAQQNFIQNFNQHSVSILIGKPGTGKSFVTGKAIDNMNIDTIVVLGPTGMSVKNIQKKIQKKTRCHTIHSFMGLKDLNRITVLVVDEFGMVSTQLMYKLCKFITKSLPNLQKIILIGDSNQLEPIGYGSPLKYLVYSKCICTTVLDKIVRQDNTTIPKLCSLVNKGNFPGFLKKFQKGNHIPFKNRLVMYDELRESLLDIYADIKFSIISNTNNGCIYINKYIQDRVYQRGYDSEKSVKFFIEDRVIVVKNSSEKGVVNGDFGYISDMVYLDSSRQLAVEIVLENGNKIKYDLKVRKRVFDNGLSLKFANGSTKSDVATNDTTETGGTDSSPVVTTASDQTPCRRNTTNYKVFIFDNVKYYVCSSVDNCPFKPGHCPFELGYCTTVHKYQGSETDMGLIYIDKKGSYIQSRSLLYTAISRCKSKIVLVGELLDIRRIIERRNVDSFSYLDKLLMEDIGPNEPMSTNFLEDYYNFNWFDKPVKLGNIRLEIKWKEYKLYSNHTFKSIVSKYSEAILAKKLINLVIFIGDKDELNDSNIALFYKYIKSRIH